LARGSPARIARVARVVRILRQPRAKRGAGEERVCPGSIVYGGVSRLDSTEWARHKGIDVDGALHAESALRRTLVMPVR
jgi:hypothetical protein